MDAFLSPFLGTWLRRRPQSLHAYVYKYCLQSMCVCVVEELLQGKFKRETHNTKTTKHKASSETSALQSLWVSLDLQWPLDPPLLLHSQSIFPFLRLDILTCRREMVLLHTLWRKGFLKGCWFYSKTLFMSQSSSTGWKKFMCVHVTKWVWEHVGCTHVAKSLMLILSFM